MHPTLERSEGSTLSSFLYLELSTQHRNVSVSRPLFRLCASTVWEREVKKHSDGDSEVCLDLPHLILCLRVSKRVCSTKKKKGTLKVNIFYIMHGLVFSLQSKRTQDQFREQTHEDKKKWTHLGPRVHGNKHKSEGSRELLSGSNPRAVDFV